ncbi:MAG: hypothetical protein K2K57_09320 [Oscillospiraceae bacterium]|nr:hypothetical protein [Oscillospiraceae bacterium]
MGQPTKREISEKLLRVISGEISREEFQTRAENFIVNDDKFEVDNHDAWNYLVYGSVMCERDHTGNYIYSNDDIKGLINEYDREFYTKNFLSE